MSRKDYIKIAQLLRAYKERLPRQEFDELVMDLATLFKRDNERFSTRQDGTVGCALDVIASEIDFAGGGRPAEEATGLEETAPAPSRAEEPARTRPRQARPVEEVLADDDVPF